MKEEDEHYRNYFKEDVDESGNRRPPKPKDWDNAAMFARFLEVFKYATVKFNASLTVTSSLYFHRVSPIQSLLTAKCQDANSILNAMARENEDKV